MNKCTHCNKALAYNFRPFIVGDRAVEYDKTHFQVWCVTPGCFFWGITGVGATMKRAITARNKLALKAMEDTRTAKP